VLARREAGSVVDAVMIRGLLEADHDLADVGVERDGFPLDPGGVEPPSEVPDSLLVGGPED
jgi:hypothetical protein